MSNWSKWWVFFKIYGEGLPESDLIVPRNHVMSTLEKFHERIDLKRFEGISLEEFLDICEPNAWRYLLRASRRVRDENADLRGVFPELLAAIQLGQDGYQQVRVGFKHHQLGDMELDAIGIMNSSKGGRVMIVEAKGQADSTDDLEREVGEFYSKLKYLRERKEQLAIAIGYEGAIVDVRGRFVSMAKFDDRNWDLHELEVWDYKRFMNELRKARLPRRLLDQLQPGVLAEVLDFDVLAERMRAARAGGSAPDRINLAWFLGLEDRDSL